ncbi:MAG TPA: hypothetical protein VFZ86_04000 [Thermoleophilia bacterium]|nr:hypothetical protein [Thermoleophilia bacterium]
MVSPWVRCPFTCLNTGRRRFLHRLRRNIERLPGPAWSRLTLESDDRVYTPSDLLPVFADTGVAAGLRSASPPLPADGLSVAEIDRCARKTWPSRRFGLEVEAKAKELAVARLIADPDGEGARRESG